MSPVNTHTLSRQMIDSACEHLQNVTTQHYKEILEAALLQHRSPDMAEVKFDGTFTHHRMKARPFAVSAVVDYSPTSDLFRVTVDIGFPVEVNGGARYYLLQEMSHQDVMTYGEKDALQLTIRLLEERVVHTFITIKEDLEDEKPLDDGTNLRTLEDLNPHSKEETKRLVEQAKRARADRQVRELIEEQERLQDPLVAMF